MGTVHQLIRTEVLTKAVNFINKQRGDEGENIRLLSSFQKQFPYRILDLTQIRDQVFKINTTNGPYILKGYSSFSRLKLQEAFASSLKKEGFHNTYSFFNMNQDPIINRNKYYGCLEYIEPNNRSFSYVNEKDRQEGLTLLEEFYLVTENSVLRYQSIISEFNLQKKWTERLSQFLKNVKAVSKYVPKDMILEWIHWAKWSLEGIQKNYHTVADETRVILHGDVAHHNFLRRKDGELFLIDFDLICIGSKNMDFLQYANRILPFINWDFQALSQYKSFNDLFSKEAYIYALAYPTDLFREWNRIIREKPNQNSYKLQQVMNQTYLKMELRQKFITDLMSLTTTI
jgi:hypothetical protein